MRLTVRRSCSDVDSRGVPLVLIFTSFADKRKNAHTREPYFAYTELYRCTIHVRFLCANGVTSERNIRACIHIYTRTCQLVIDVALTIQQIWKVGWCMVPG